MDEAFKDELQDRTKRFAIDVIKFCSQLDGYRGLRRVADQLVDAAGSVAANHRAMRRARSPREFAAKTHIVLEEADESVLWLEIVDGVAPQVKGTQPLLNEATQLRNLFARTEATARRRVNRKQPAALRGS